MCVTNWLNVCDWYPLYCLIYSLCEWSYSFSLRAKKEAETLLLLLCLLKWGERAIKLKDPDLFLWWLNEAKMKLAFSAPPPPRVLLENRTHKKTGSCNSHLSSASSSLFLLLNPMLYNRNTSPRSILKFSHSSMCQAENSLTQKQYFKPKRHDNFIFLSHFH